MALIVKQKMKKDDCPNVLRQSGAESWELPNFKAKRVRS